MSTTDYTREPSKLADLIESVIFGAGNAINGRQLLLLRNAMDELRGAGAAAIKRRAALQNEQRKHNLFTVDVVVRDLSFADLHANISHWDCPDMCADGEQVLTAYYVTDEDDGGDLFIELHHVTPAAPLVIKGEDRDLAIGAGADILADLVKDRQDEIKDKVMSAIRMLAGEARVDAAMAEAA